MIARTHKRVQGFSLLEVLVAIAILSFGLLALASLQISLVRAGAATKAQSEALSLSKEQLEDLRAFTTIAGYQALTSGSNSVVSGGVTYGRAWTVVRFVYNQDIDADGILSETGDQGFQSTTTLTGATPTSPAGFVANNEFKVIDIATTWTDSTGASQSIALVDATGAISPNDSSLIGKAPTTTVARRIPIVIKNPALDAMVIPIAISDSSNSAATNPKPQVVVGQSTVETQFDVLTYGAITGDTAVAQQRVETVMVGCYCDYSTAPASTVRGKRPTYWDGTRYTVPLTTTYSPPAGIQASKVDEQSPRCDICCRDHHDPAGTTGGLFSPLKATKSSGTVTAAHPHFLDKVTATPVTSGTYKEACRLIRIDGQWRVAADMNNDYFALLATGDGTTAGTSVPDSTSVAGTPPVVGSVARYQNFVLGYLQNRFVTPTPSSSAAQATYNTVGAPATAANPYVMAASAPYVLDNPAAVSINLSELTGKWLHSRAVYIDYLEQDAVNAITDAKTDAACTVDADALSECILKLLPFTSINLTEISDWSPLSGELSVTNFDYSTSLASGLPVRGKVTTSASVASNINAITAARKSNSGLLDLTFDSISPDDDVKVNDSQVFAVGGGSPASTAGNGAFSVTRSYTGTSAVAISYLTTGAAATISCGLASPYLCNVQNGSSSAGLDVNAGMSIDVGGYNHAQSVSGTTSPTLVDCTGTGNAASLLPISVTNTAVGPQPYTSSVCKNYEVTAVSTTNPNPGTISWALAPTSLADGRVNPYPGEVTRISFTGKITSGTQAWATLTNYLQDDVVTDGGNTYRALTTHLAGPAFPADLALGNWAQIPNWSAATGYAVNALVLNSGKVYKALSAHTSGGTFATDLAASRWVQLNNVAITLGLTASTPQTPSSCTYDCGNGNSGGQTQGGKCKTTTNFYPIYPACP